MRCQSCQTALPDDAQFCASCGLPTSRHPTDAATQLDQQQQTNADAPRATDEQVGWLSSDGKKLTGTGKDAFSGSIGMKYEFSFTRK
ncbi:MAG TPA: zinc-ribbon domain-containing protein [Pyrinomonadaceae bacterium]|nr:zinc-ribbon domain-containing protein [Pyrinomonadaceae bacterium]